MLGMMGEALGCDAAQGEDRLSEVLTLSHWVPATHYVHGALEEWSRSLEENSQCGIKVKLFPAQQLGRAADHYDMARFGIVDIAWVNPGYQHGRHPIFSAGQLPFLIEDAISGSAVFDRWYKKYAPLEMGDVHYCLSFFHEPGVLHTKEKIISAQDLRGLKVRPANATISRYLSSFGAVPINLAAGETRDALDKGVANAITFPWATVINLGLTKSVRYHLDLPLYTSATALVINKRKYNRLSVEARIALDNHCTPLAAKKLAIYWAQKERAGKKYLSDDSDRAVYSLSVQEELKWREASKPFEVQWKKKVRKRNLDGDKELLELKAALRAGGDAHR